MVEENSRWDEVGAWVCARLCAQMEVEPAEVGLSAWGELGPTWGRLAEAVVNRGPGVGALEAFQRASAEMADRESVLREVLATNPRRRPPLSAPTQGQGQGGWSLVPSLPASAALPEGAVVGAREAGGWLDAYVRYARAVSPLTPLLFHESAGLALISLAIARRMVLRLAHKDVFPNLAILWIAPTTLYAKSTALAVPRFLAVHLMPHLLLPGEMSPESMVDELAGKKPQFGLDPSEIAGWTEARAFAGQRGVMLDEASTLFVGMGKRDYQVGMSETLLRVYDCDPLYVRQTKGGGRSSIRDAYWTFLGATTPQHLKRADIDALWYEGLWPRFLLITPEEVMPWVEPSKRRIEIPGEVREGLEGLLGKLPPGDFEKPPEALSVELGEGVFEAYRRYLKATMREMLTQGTVDRRLWGVYGRFGEQALKTAILLAAMDWAVGDPHPLPPPLSRSSGTRTGEGGREGVPRVEMGHWARAQQFVERCRESVHRLPGLLEMSEGNEDEDKVLGYLAECRAWCSARDVYRPLHMRATEVKGILADLEEAGLVEYGREMKKWRVKETDEAREDEGRWSTGEF